MTTYRIIPITQGGAAHWCIIETRADGSERIVSEHATEDDAVEYLGQLRDRSEFRRANT